jgi:hypothetical protein
MKQTNLLSTLKDEGSLRDGSHVPPSICVYICHLQSSRGGRDPHNLFSSCIPYIQILRNNNVLILFIIENNLKERKFINFPSSLLQIVRLLFVNYYVDM